MFRIVSSVTYPMLAREISNEEEYGAEDWCVLQNHLYALFLLVHYCISDRDFQLVTLSCRC